MFVINGTLARHALTQRVTQTEELAYHPESTRQKPARFKHLSFHLVTNFAGEMHVRSSISFVVLAVLTVGGAWQTPVSFSFRGLATVVINGTLARHALVTNKRLSDARPLAHAGRTGPEIMAISGHSSLAQMQVHIDGVAQERMAEAAMDKLVKGSGN